MGSLSATVRRWPLARSISVRRVAAVSATISVPPGVATIRKWQRRDEPHDRGAYPVSAVPGWVRPPHIHFDVQGSESRLVTQMHFEGEDLNAKDRFFDRPSPAGKEGLLARYGA